MSRNGVTNTQTAPATQGQPVPVMTIPPVIHQVTMRVYDADGWDEFYTIKATTVNELAHNVATFKTWLKEKGYSPAPAPQRSANAGGQPAPTPAGVPTCPDGHGAMKASTKKPGEYFCPAVVGNHPQTGKKLYCTHKFPA